MYDLFRERHPELYDPDICSNIDFMPAKGWWFFDRKRLNKPVFVRISNAFKKAWFLMKTPDSRSGMKGKKRLKREGRT